MSDVPRLNPKMMVIGDSLAQGCRNLSVNAGYCAQSWGSRMAAFQGFEFITPDFPRDVLFDLEKEIRLLDTLSLSLDKLKLSDAVSRIRDNLRAWLEFPGGSHYSCFDNLGLSGAKIYDLYTRTSDSSAADIRQKTTGGGGPDGALRMETLGGLHLSINARFTLNPSQDPAFAGYTPLDWVEKRQPEILCVQIGHNHGLFAVGFSAEDSGITIGDPYYGSYWDQWKSVASRLAGLPESVKTILIVLLPKVGATANLMPVGDERVNGYATYYQPVLSTHTTSLSGQRLRGIDLEIQEINKQIKTLTVDAQTTGNPGLVNRLKFLDTYNILDRFDYKNTLDQARRLQLGAGAIDNRYLHGNLEVLAGSRFPLDLSAGGFLSLDGMHPSGCGYAILAAQAANVLGLATNQAAMLDQAFNQDTLLSRYPVELDILVQVLSILRKCIITGEFIHAPVGPLSDDAHLADVLRVMKTIFLP
jgi:hypothetical protein